ncbi:hypothetical protein HanRHA438_Chr10g0436041 [Helianthus annuus]|nr:hypothetical protein HanRHA438_Chr10g0436041 [Helianthus annuus]
MAMKSLMCGNAVINYGDGRAECDGTEAESLTLFQDCRTTIVGDDAL